MRFARRRPLGYDPQGRAAVVLTAFVAAAAIAGFLVARFVGKDPPVEKGSRPDVGQGFAFLTEVSNLGVPTRAAASLQPKDDGSTMSAEERQFRDLIANDPRAAAVLVTRTDSIAQWDAWLPAVMEAWVDRAPQEAVAWLEILPRGDFRTTASQEFFLAAATNNPEVGAAWIARRAESGNPLPDGTAAFVGAWADEAPDEAKAWAEQLGDAAPKKIIGSLAYALAAAAPEAAAAWFRSLDDPSKATIAASNIAVAWGASEPEAAIKWINGQTAVAGKNRENISLGLLQSWAFDDPVNAAGWVKQQADGPLKESAKAFLGEALGDDHPAEGLAWANAIADPEQRSETMANIYDAWLANDAEEAKLRLLSDVAAVPPGDPLRESLLDLLYQHDAEFRQHVLLRATE